MKIQSDFKDYYDYVPFLSGGSGDPKIFYDRSNTLPIFKKTNENTLLLKVPKTFLPLNLPRYGDKIGWQRNSKKWFWKLKWLCLIGKIYLVLEDSAPKAPEEVVPPWDGYLVPTPTRLKLLQDSHQCFLDFSEYSKHMFRGRDYLEKVRSLSEGVYSEDVVNLSREVGSPAFFISHLSMKGSDLWATVLPETPRLGDLGLAKKLPPERMYQEISYFVGNTLHKSPDIDPPAGVCEKSRLVQRGFDPKTSFRGKAV